MSTLCPRFALIVLVSSSAIGCGEAANRGGAANGGTSAGGTSVSRSTGQTGGAAPGATQPAGTGGHALAPTAGSLAAAGSGGGSATAGASSAGSGGTTANANAGATSTAGNSGSAGTMAATDAGISTDGGLALGPGDTLIPDTSWDCRMPSGIPSVQGANMVFEAELTLGDVMDLGQTQLGARTILPITGGSFTGPKLKGTFMTGGLDWQLTRDNGALEIEEVAILTTDGGESIYLRNCGLAPSAAGEVRIVPDFEAPSGGSADFLNMGMFIGTREVDLAKKSLTLRVYEAPQGTPSATSVHVPALPASEPRQVWNCEPPAGSAGALVYVENVAIGGGIAIGPSKYGSRNIIPITGGTFSGQKLNGDVVVGGADFQLTPNGSSDLELDARYTLHTSDGEPIAVRNCGNAFGTKLYFESRASGNYAWLSQGKYTSSVSLAIGGVMISIYEAQ